ncbi:hypothetical protein ACFV84_22445 [Kitasatospora sp. NPDC059811]|uniref:hypothetical protein n=1 Tax=Streptomycetaceae TaxID=2062 RepID=UPI0007AFB676|nr:hypothetical protein [Streptomyces sp. MJM8645]
MTDLATSPVGGSRKGSLEPEGAIAPRPGRLDGLLERPWAVRSAEALVSIVAAFGFALLCTRIDVNPLNRVGQVSGLAMLQKYAAIVGLPILAVLLYAAYRGSLARYQLAQRLVCAAVAGLATGAVAGGIAVALNGTQWGLGGQEGDPGNLMGMANDMLRGKGLPGVYPPGFPALLAVWSKLFYGGVGGVGYAMKDVQLICSALVGPMAYLSWRLMLRPVWALLIAVPSAILFLDPIRPYSHVTMLVMVPMLAAALRELRRSHELSTRSTVLRGLGFGVSFGLMFLWYSGWFVWAAPGVLVLTLFVIPWRQGAARIKRVLLFLGVTLVSAGVVGSPLLYELVRLGAQAKDRYAYLSVYIDPAYIMGWASDRNGDLNYHDFPWHGELAGQSAYTLLLLAGVALALGLGLRSITVRTVTATLISAWLLRFWFASQMAQTKSIQLYPRTTWIILYALMILAVLGLMFLVQRGAGWLRTVQRVAAVGRPAPLTLRPAVTGRLVAGAVCAVALFATMAASWSADRYMPTTKPEFVPVAGAKGIDMGADAWRAHILVNRDGKCPKYDPAGPTDCAPVNKELKEYNNEPDKGQLWCANVTGDEWALTCGSKRPW